MFPKRILIFAIFGACWSLNIVRAAPPVDFLEKTVSQIIGNHDVIVDECGDALEGTDPYSYLWGIPTVTGDVVQVILATDGVIHPPSVDGTPHSHNQVLMTLRIGMGMSPTYERSGKFSCALSPRPNHGTKIFCRVFNAPSLEDSTFYNDSQLYSVNNSEFLVFYSEFNEPMKPLNPAFPDPLCSKFEEENDSPNPDLDSDGDSYTDEQELVAGTDPYDRDSFLCMAGLTTFVDQFFKFEWDAIPGKTYVVEYSIPELEGEYLPLWRGVVADTVGRLWLPMDLPFDMMCFRVCFVAE